MGLQKSVCKIGIPMEKPIEKPEIKAGGWGIKIQEKETLEKETLKKPQENWSPEKNVSLCRMKHWKEMMSEKILVDNMAMAFERNDISNL